MLSEARKAWLSNRLDDRDLIGDLAIVWRSTRTALEVVWGKPCQSAWSNAYDAACRLVFLDVPPIAKFSRLSPLFFSDP